MRQGGAPQPLGGDMWKRGGRQISWEKLLEDIESLSSHPHTLVVGSDSQPFREGTVMVTAVCFICEERSHHGRYYFMRRIIPAHHNNLYLRLYDEVMASIQAALRIRDNVGGVDISIHIDASEKESKASSGRHSKGLVNMALGYGFRSVEIKPDSWAASSVADRHTKKPIKRIARG